MEINESGVRLSSPETGTNWVEVECLLSDGEASVESIPHMS